MSDIQGFRYDNPADLVNSINENGRVFVISDTHFFHRRLWEVLHKTEDGGRDPNNTQSIMQLWANTVKEDDMVLHLGDVVVGLPVGEISQNVRWLPGNIFLLPGNHDRTSQKLNIYRNCGWAIIQPFDVIINDLIVHFSHEPIPPEEILPNVLNVHGHIHQNEPFSYQYANCSIEILGDAPVFLCDVIDHQISLYRQHKDTIPQQ